MNEILNSNEFKELISAYIHDNDFGDLVKDLVSQNDGLIDYKDYHRRYIVRDVKCYLGSINTPTNEIEQYILNLCTTSIYNDTDKYEIEFDCIKNDFSDLGELIVLGQSGGYWGFEHFKGNNVIPNMDVIYKDILDSLDNISNLFNACELFDIWLEMNPMNDKYWKLDPEFKSRIDVFIERCDKLVEYWSDANNILDHFDKPMEEMCDILNYELNGETIKLDPIGEFKFSYDINYNLTFDNKEINGWNRLDEFKNYVKQNLKGNI